jgi:hypothetical protein
MLAIPENVLARFNEVLRQRAVQGAFHVHYRKWLRYFLDFCQKYPPPETKSEQVRLFIAKLKSKKQTPQQWARAAHAISLFYESQRTINRPPSIPLEVKGPLAICLPHSPPPRPRFAKSDVIVEKRLPAIPTGAVAERSSSDNQFGGKRYNEWRCFER